MSIALHNLLKDKTRFALSVSGVALWWPVGEKRVHVLPPGLRLRTGSLAEYAMLMVVGAVIGIAFVRF